MVSFRQKLKLRKTCEKRFFNHIRVVLCKKPFGKMPNIRVMRRFRKSGILKGYSLAKWSVFVKNYNSRKTCEKRFFNHIRVVLCKKPLEKTPNIREWDDFENRPSCKGYSLCKMVSLGQKLKFRKAWEERFFNHELFSVKSPLRKHQIFEKWDDLKIGHQGLCNMVSLGQKLKFCENVRKTIFNHLRVVLCKKPLEKTPNIREMRRFWKSAIVQTL